MKKKLAIIAIIFTAALILGGFNSTVLYTTQYLESKPGYTYSVTASIGWWNCNWSYCKKITIDNDKVSATLTNYPVLIHTSADADLAAHAQSDGDDIAFVDSNNITQYPHQIEYYDSSTGNLSAWVKVSSVSASTDTILYMYYGNSVTTSQQNATSVWDSSFKLVQHLNETSDTAYDATSNNNDGTQSGGVAQNVNGKIDGADQFDGIDDYIDCGDDSSLNITAQITLEAWVKDPPITQLKTFESNVEILDKRDERQTVKPGEIFIVERTVSVDHPGDIVFIALSEPGVELIDMKVDQKPVDFEVYTALNPSTNEELRIERIRTNLPQELKKLPFVIYSDSFSVSGTASISMVFTTVDQQLFELPDGSISYLVITSDDHYDFECTTHWSVTEVGIWDPFTFIFQLMSSFFIQEENKDTQYLEFDKTSKNELVSIEDELKEQGESRVIIKFDDASSFNQTIEDLADIGFQSTAEVDVENVVAGIVDSDHFEQIINNENIQDLYLDKPFSVLLESSLPLISYDVAVEQFNLTGKGIKICILDTGCNPTVVNYTQGYDFVYEDTNPDDVFGHGTRIATVIHQIAPDAELYIAKVIADDGTGYESDVLEGLQWCINQQPDIISFSIGSTQTYDGFYENNLVISLCNQAVQQGIFVVAAAGNNGKNQLVSPACGRNITSVGATDDSDEIAEFSNVNQYLDMVAPGVNIGVNGWSTSGTSMSTPHVTGAAALLLENTSLNPSHLRYRLKSTGKPIKYYHNDTHYITIPRIDVYSILTNNKTIEPHQDYQPWQQDNTTTLPDTYKTLDDTVIYYFNNHDGSGLGKWTNPDNLADGAWNTFASCMMSVSNTLQDNEGDGTDLGTISKVELRCHGYYSGSGTVGLTPKFDGSTLGTEKTCTVTTSAANSSWQDITEDGAGPGAGGWDWNDIQNLDCKVDGQPSGKGANVYCARVEVQITYSAGGGNNAPTLGNPNPSDNSFNISLPPSNFSIKVNDPEGNSMDISFRSNETGHWSTAQTNNTVNNGTYHLTNKSWVDTKGIKYFWSVNVSDGNGGWTNNTYSFTTRKNHNPINTNPYPSDSLTGVQRIVNLSITVNDVDDAFQDMNVTFRTNATGSWGTINTNSSVNNGTYSQSNSSMNSLNTKYWWSVNTSDGQGGWDNDTYSFTTGPPFLVNTTTVTDATWRNGGRKLTRTSNGELHTVYVRAYNGKDNIMYANSTDNGESWSETMLTSDGTYAQNGPSIAVDSSDQLHVVWYGVHSGSAANSQIRYRKNTGSGWTNTTNLTKNAGLFQAWPSIAVDSSDDLHVVWFGLAPNVLGTMNIRYMKNTSGTWGSITNLTLDDVNFQSYPSIAVDSSGRIHVVWQGTHDDSAVNSQIRACRYSSGSWNNPVNITKNSDYPQSYPTVCVGASNYVHVVWEGKHVGSTTNVQIRYSEQQSGAASAWVGDIVNLTYGADTSYPQEASSISVDQDDDIFVVWAGDHKGSAGIDQIRTVTYSSGSWSTPENLTTATGNQRTPNLVWAYYPQEQVRPYDGYGLVFTDNTDVTYDYSSDLTWNRPPTQSHPEPDETIDYVGVRRCRDYVNVTLSDADGDLLDWTIETSPNIGSSSGNNEAGGNKSCTIQGLGWHTMYTWYVNVTDGEDWTNESYTFYTGPPFRVGTSTDNNPLSFTSQRKLTRTSNGDLHAAFESEDDIVYAKSTDKGVNWTYTTLTSSNNNYGASIAVDSSDNLHVVWYGKQGGLSNTQIQYRKYTDGVGWGSLVNITDNNTDQTVPSIAVDSSDNLHVVYMNGTTAGTSSIKYVKNTGSGWTGFTNLTNKSIDQEYPMIAVDGNDDLHVVWHGNYNAGSNDQIRYAKFSSGSWIEAINLTDDDTYDQLQPVLTIDGDDTVHVVWYGAYSGSPSSRQQIRYKNFSSADGWSTYTNITTETEHQWKPTIAVDNTDDIHVIWYNGSSYQPNNATLHNGVWSSINQLTQFLFCDQVGALWARYPVNVCQPATGFAFLAEIKLYYFNSSDLTWAVAPVFSSPQPANQSTGISVLPSTNITINDADGEDMTIAYYSNYSGNWDELGNITLGSNNRFGFDEHFPGLDDPTDTLTNTIRGTWFTCPADGTATNITVRLTINAGLGRTVNFKGAIYYRSNKTALATTEQTTSTNFQGNADGQWITLNFAGTKPNLVAGRQYYVLLWSDTDGSSSCPIHYEKYTNANRSIALSQAYGLWPNPFSGETYETDKLYEIYVNYNTTSTSSAKYYMDFFNASLYGKKYFWNVSANDGTTIANSNKYHFTTSWGAPQVSTNASFSVEETSAGLAGYLLETGGEQCTCRLEYGATSAYGTNTSNQTLPIETGIFDSATSLTPGSLYHVRAYANNSDYSDTGADKTFVTKPNPATSIAITNISGGYNISWTHAAVGNYNNSVLVYKTTGYPTSPTDGTELFNDTQAYYEHTGLSKGTTYYYRVWEYAEWPVDGTTPHQFSDDNESKKMTYGSQPTVITNASTGVEETNATLRGWLSNNGGLSTKTGFRYGTSSGSYSGNFTYGTASNGTEFYNDTTSLTAGQKYFFQAWANNTGGWNTGSELTFLTKPQVPTSLTAQANSSSMIFLSWTKGTGANNTYIERNATNDQVWTRGQGSMIYNGTAESYEDSSLNDGVHYYYQAWSYTSWGDLSKWSDANASADNKTNSKPTIDLRNPRPNETTDVDTTPTCRIWANDSDGDTLTIWWYENSTGSWVLRNSNKTVTANTSNGFSFTQFNQYSTRYWWKVSVNDGLDNVTEWFRFTTSTQEIPDPPSSFVATMRNKGSIRLTWSKGANADNTVIEVNSTAGDSVWSRGDGTVVYNGSAELFTHNGLSPNTWYYYQAWSWNTTDTVFSSTNASASNKTNIPPSFMGETPTNESTDVATSLSTINVTINDSDGHSLRWSIETVPDIGSNSSWWNTSWDYRKLITLDSSFVSASLINYPVLVSRSSDSDLATRAQGDGDDICFILYSDNTTQLNHEIENFDSGTGELEAWVNLTRVTASSNTKFWMYYGNDGCGNQENNSGVWDSNFIMVQHYGESTDPHADSSKGNHDGNETDGADQTTTSKINGGLYVDGSGDYLDTGHWNVSGQTITVEAWVKPNATGTNAREAVLGKWQATANERSYALMINEGTGRSGNVVFGVSTDGTNYNASTTGNSVLSAGQWHHLAGTYDGTDNLIYLNGSSQSLTELYAAGTVSGSIYSCPVRVRVGSVEIWGGAERFVKAKIDEARISKVVRNSSWIGTSFHTTNMSTGFLSIGSQEDGETNGSKTCSVSGLSSATTYTWYVNCTDGYDWTNESYTFTTVSNVPNPPTGFTAVMRNKNSIRLNWSKGANADNTVIEVNSTAGDSVWSRGDGTVVYNGSAELFTHNGLSPNTWYYYQAWSWNSTDSVFSSSNASASNRTNRAPTVHMFDPSPNGTTGVVLTPSCRVFANDSDGDSLTVRWYENTTGSWVHSNVNSSVSSNSTVMFSFSEFSSYSTRYWWRVSVNDSFDNVSRWYYFTTQSGNTAPSLSNEVPTNASSNVALNSRLGLQVSDAEGHAMNITWYWGTDNSCPNYIGKNSSISNGTYYMPNDNNFSNYATTYYWHVVVNDGEGGWTNATYHFTTLSSHKKIIYKNQSIYSLELSASGSTLYGYVKGTNVSTSIDTNWHYVVLTYDGSNLRLYKDGKQSDSTALSGAISTTAENVLLGQYLSGKMDEIRISSTARSGAWIYTTYNNTNSPTTFASFGSETGILSAWAYRKKITIESDMVSASLIDFPVLIYNSSDNHLKNNAHSAGNDIIFMNTSITWTNSTIDSKLDHEIEKFDNTTGELVAWVRIPRLEASTDKEIYMYYGNTACQTNRQNINGVWDENFVMVQHYGESTDPHADSSKGNHDGNETDGADQTTTSKINGGLYVDGSGDYLDTGHWNVSGQTITVEAWVKPNATGSNAREGVIGKWEADSNQRSYALFVNEGSGRSGNIVFGISSDGTNYNVSTTGNSVLSAGQWHHLAGTYDGTDNLIYLNGTSQALTELYAAGTVSGNINSCPIELRVGSAEIWGAAERFVKAKIDEARISKVVRNSSWISSSFHTMNRSSGFLTYGVQEVQPAAPVQSSPSPSNGATSQNQNPRLSLSVNDSNADLMTVNFLTNATGEWGTIGSNASVTNGTYSQTNTSMNSFGKKYYWSVNVTDGTYWANTTYTFVVRSQYIPNPPSSFTATSESATQINLTWTKGTNADKTYIERNQSGATSWARGAGIQIFNATNAAFTDSGLKTGATYYYQAWSWNTTDTVFSSTYASDNAVPS